MTVDIKNIKIQLNCTKIRTPEQIYQLTKMFSLGEENKMQIPPQSLVQAACPSLSNLNTHGNGPNPPSPFLRGLQFVDNFTIKLSLVCDDSIKQCSVLEHESNSFCSHRSAQTHPNSLYTCSSPRDVWDTTASSAWGCF